MRDKKTPFFPLCVDLDGTLLINDTTWRAVFLYIKNSPWRIVKVFSWLVQGRAYLKQELAKSVTLDPSSFTYSSEVIDLIQDYKKKGHLIYLVTATDKVFAQQMADHVGGFDAIFASDGICNLRAKAKADFLVRRWGEKGFIYIGNSWDDLKVWDKAFKGYAAYPSKRLYKKLRLYYPQVTLITPLK